MPSQNYSKFKKRIAELKENLGSEEFGSRVEAKVFSWIQRNGDDLGDMSAKDMRRALQEVFRPELAAFASRIITRYDDILTAVNEYYSDLGVDITRDLNKIARLEEVNTAQLGRYEISQTASIQRAIREGLLAGEGVADLQQRLKKLGGTVANYSKAIAQTQVHGYGRTGKMEKARLGEVEWFEYVGPSLTNTRDFCLNCLSTGYFHIKTIRNLRNNNLEPVERYCGGWRCIHDLEPDPFYKGN